MDAKENNGIIRNIEQNGHVWYMLQFILISAHNLTCLTGYVKWLDQGKLDFGLEIDMIPTLLLVRSHPELSTFSLMR